MTHSQPELPALRSRRKHETKTGWPRVRVDTAAARPEPNIEYVFKLPGSVKATRQTGLSARWTAVTNARHILRYCLNRPVREDDFIIFSQGGRFGFVPAGGTPPKDYTPPSESRLSSAERAEVFEVLMGLIDPETGRYTGEASDVSVAAVLGHLEDEVIIVRRFVFGDPDPDPGPEEAAILRAALAALQAEGDDLREMLDSWTARAALAIGELK